MSTPSKEDILRINIGRSRKTLLEAQKMMEHNFTNAAMNRLYYACFYAATALLFKKDVFIKNHSGVKQMPGLHYVVSGTLPKEMGKFYSDIFASRLGSDYDDFADADPEIVKEYSIPANEFVSSAQKILEL
jgi:uncharacterized protein (UPF0332 family)